MRCLRGGVVAVAVAVVAAVVGRVEGGVADNCVQSTVVVDGHAADAKGAEFSGPDAG